MKEVGAGKLLGDMAPHDAAAYYFTLLLTG